MKQLTDLRLYNLWKEVKTEEQFWDELEGVQPKKIFIES